MTGKEPRRVLSTMPDPVLFCLFELGLGLFALLLAWPLLGGLGGIRLGGFPDSLRDGALLSLPLLVFAAFATSEAGLSLKPLRRIYGILRDSPIGRYVRGSGWPAFLALSLAAGGAEELLFRAVLQAKLGLAAASLLFGALHAVSASYFLAASLIGAYLGRIYEGHGLLAAALAHALYDFAALLLYRRRMLRDRSSAVLG